MGNIRKIWVKYTQRPGDTLLFKYFLTLFDHQVAYRGGHASKLMHTDAWSDDKPAQLFI